MSAEHETELKLVLHAESIAQTLDLREPDWDDFERRLTASLASAPDVDDALFAAPLPELEEERRARLGAEPRESVSLADLARATVAKRAENEAASLVKASLALASQQRAQVERIAERKPSALERPVAAAPEAAPPKAPAGRSSAWDSRGPWIGVAVAAVGLAASFGLYFASQGTRTVIVTQAPVASAPTAPATAAPKLPEAEKRSSPEAGNRAGSDLSAGPSAEAVAQASPAATGEDPAEAKAELGVPATNAGASKAKPERVVLKEERPTPGAGTAAPSSALRPAELKPTGGISDRPSTGAAQAAVGAVLGAARACLAGQTAPSSATLVFGSDGEVNRVQVTGAAAGTPAENCVEAALKKARVQPFAAPSFSLGVTVRPL
jgi:hypothetical protein